MLYFDVILKYTKKSFPTINIQAYIDDVILQSDNSKMLQSTFDYINQQIINDKMKINTSKSQPVTNNPNEIIKTLQQQNTSKPLPWPST